MNGCASAYTLHVYLLIMLYSLGALVAMVCTLHACSGPNRSYQCHLGSSSTPCSAI